MDYDVITVGGGLAGSSLAYALAQAGRTVLVLERETEFRDRVRGEVMQPWGVVDAQKIGIHQLLCESCATELPKMAMEVAGIRLPERNLLDTTPHGTAMLTFYHPEMQTVLLRAAEAAGAEVRRGATVIGVEPGSPPTVTARIGSRQEQLSARLVVGADGRRSKVRRWAGLVTSQDPQRCVIAGVLMEGMNIPDDTAQFVTKTGPGHTALAFPLTRDRTRVYACYRKGDADPRLSGTSPVPELGDFCVKAGAPAEWYDGAEAVGPLASFEGADHWVDHPYREGVVLVGDAAAASDPTWGQGTALTARDVRVLRDELLADDDWDAAAHRYATEHDRHYGVVHTVDSWMTDLLMEVGPHADAVRARALPLLAQDPTRVPDQFGEGPESACDETARRRLFGDDIEA
jgi:2-polyprenyl-6-methoxyphenol hydroxylase-like FAD-dependent oxidoreductase